MGLFDDIFYDLVPDLIEMFVDEPRKFYVTETSSRPFAHPSEVTEYSVPREYEILCSPPYKAENTEDSGGVSRHDITSKRKDSIHILMPDKNIPEGIVFEPNQSYSIETDYNGRRLTLIDYSPIQADRGICRILTFKA